MAAISRRLCHAVLEADQLLHKDVQVERCKEQFDESLENALSKGRMSLEQP